MINCPSSVLSIEILEYLIKQIDILEPPISSEIDTTTILILLENITMELLSDVVVSSVHATRSIHGTGCGPANCSRRYYCFFQ